MKVVFQHGEKIYFKDCPHKNILYIWFVESVIFALVIGFMLFLLVLIPTQLFATGNMALFVLIFLGLFLAVLVMVFLYFVALRKSYKYNITQQRVIFEGGIIIKRIKSVPFHKITDVSISQNIVEKAFGIAKLNVHTAGTGFQYPEIQFVGLANAEKPQSVVVNFLKRFQTTRHASTYSE